MKVRKAVIPAAGLGTRFLPVTKTVPKEMVPIVDVPTIQYIVDEAVASGIEQIVLVTARGKGAIEDYFDYHYELDDTLEKRGKRDLRELSRRAAETCTVISVRQKEPLGLGHAVLTAREVIGNEPFAVLLGDEVMVSDPPCLKQLIDCFEREKGSVIGVMEVPPTEVSKYGIVGGDSISKNLMRIRTVVEKPEPARAPSRYAIPGRYVFEPEIFECLASVKPGRGGEIQLTDGIEALARLRSVFAFQFSAERFDVGDRLGYIHATLAMALKRPELRSGVLELVRQLARQS